MPRRRVQRQLQGRFDRRATVVVAGAGFGKTTALANAIAENRLSPRGQDVWLACEPADVDGERLREGLGDALGFESVPDVRAIAEAVASMSPTAVCLVLDDAHHLEAGSSGAAALTELLDELPANGSLLLGSRVEPPVPLARLEAQGQVARIGEAELALEREEIAALAAGDADLARLAGLGGWPALISLSLQTRSPAAFLDEEVVRGLGDAQREALDLIVTLGGADADLARALLGRSAVETLRSLPLVAESDGWFVPHDLWSTVVSPPDNAIDLRRAAIEHLLERGDASHALDVALEDPEGIDVVPALRAAAVPGYHVRPEQRRRWLDRLPDGARASGAGAFLAGVIARDANSGSEAARDHFGAALARFGAEGDVDGEVESIGALGLINYIRQDMDAFLSPTDRLLELADQGVQSAIPLIRLGTALGQLAADRPDEALAGVAQIDGASRHGLVGVFTAWTAAQARVDAGRPAAVEAREITEPTVVTLPAVADVLLKALWREGELEEALEFLDRPANDGTDHRFLHYRYEILVAAGLGDAARARRAHAAAISRGVTGGALGPPRLALADLLVDVEEGTVEDPAAELARLVDDSPLSSELASTYREMIGLFARWHPVIADELADGWLGPHHRRDLAIGSALRSIDSEASAAVLDLAWPDTTGCVVTAVGLRGTCELVAAAWHHAHPDAARAADWLAATIGEPARAHLHQFAAQHPVAAVAKGAADLLARTPVPPARTRRLRLLGPAQLMIGDHVVEDPNWRREKLRALLGYLVLHPTTTRDAAMVALWPEADEESGRRSLRSTLNLLNKILEPDRLPGDATFFVRADGPHLRLTRSAELEVDSWTFEALIDEADGLQRDGVPSRALGLLEEAVELYRGDFLADAAYDEWSLVERDRLRSRFVEASCRLGELRIATDQIEGAIAAAGRVLAIEPWSERAHRTTIAAYLARGDRVGARRAAEACRAALEEFGGAVDSETQMLFRRVDL